MVAALYGIATFNHNKWSYQLGLRGESTNIETYHLGETDKFNNDYSNLFPSAFINYKLNDKNAFRLSESRRINRPGGHEIDPYHGHI